MTREPLVWAGSVDGFVEWVRPQVPVVSRLVGRLAPGVERDAVVQASLARAWAKRGQYDEGRGGAWLLGIAAEVALKARPRAWALEDDELGELDARRDVDRVLASLTGRQRLAVDCFYFVGLSVAETAAVMRCSEGVVQTTLADARERLGVLLEIDA